MTSAYQEELGVLNDQLVEIANLVGTAMNRATKALLTADLTRAESVIQDDDRIDAMTSALEERCFDLIEQQQPSDRDLRYLIGALRIAASLERMGDLARHVAKQMRLRYPRLTVPDELHSTFTLMGSIAEAIVSKTGEVIRTQDVTLAADISVSDEEMDRLHRELFSIVMSNDWTHGVEAAIDVTLLSRYYERYADHAVSVTRRVISSVTGELYAGIALD